MILLENEGYLLVGIIIHLSNEINIFNTLIKCVNYLKMPTRQSRQLIVSTWLRYMYNFIH